MTTPNPEPFRCYRTSWCDDAQPEHDPVTGDHNGWVGARLDSVTGLCGVCTSKVLEALTHLPLDTAELTTLLGRALGGELREPVAGSAHGPVIPLRDDIEALRALIDHETCVWARSVADAAGVRWSTLDAHRSRLGYRVKAACHLLRARLPVLLELGPTEHRARSLGARRTDGHDPDLATRCGDDYWTTRTGVDGAILLVGLHRKAYRHARRHTNPLPVWHPCPNLACQQMALSRYPGDGHAKCAHCGHKVSEENLDVLQTAMTNSRPLPAA